MTFSRLTKSIATAATVAIISLSPAMSNLQAREAGPFAGLSGSWAGDGSVTMSDGSRERIRCRATYSVPPMGTSLNQGLRCASDSYTFDVKSNVMAGDDGALSGTWSEATRQVAGDLTGTATGGSIQTSIQTLGFSAHLSVTTHGARQSVSIRPDSSDVQSVTIEMRRI